MNIFRYPVDVGFNVVSMPSGAKIVDAVYQKERDQFSIYAEVDNNRPREKRCIHIYATGEEIQDGLHIRSIVMPDGFHVFHVYEVNL